METSDLPELTPESLRAMSRMMVFFAVAGIVVGIAGVLAVEWVLGTIPDQFGTLPTMTPMIVMFVIATLAPVIAILVGALEGPRGASRRILGEVAVGSWIGSVIYAGIALLIVGLVALQGDVGPAFLEYFSLAGLVSVGSILSGTAASASRQPRGTQEATTTTSQAVSSPPPTETTDEHEPDPEPEPAHEPETESESETEPEPMSAPDPEPEEADDEDDDGPEESPFRFD